MKNTKPFEPKERMRSLKYAWAGLKVLYLGEANAKIHLFATFCAVLMGILTKISATDWIFLLFVISLVWICELFNTAIELLCDKLTDEYDGLIKKVKDLAAAAVLVSSFLAFIVGLHLFLPPLTYSIQQLL